MNVQTIGVLYQERLRIEVKLLLSANTKSYTASNGNLAQQMTLSDLEWSFHGSSVPSSHRVTNIYLVHIK